MSRASYLLGPSAIELYTNEEYELISPSIPLILLYDKYRRLSSFRIRPSLLEDRATSKLRKKLMGRWYAVALDSSKNRCGFLFWPTQLYQIEIDQDAMDYNFGIIHIAIPYEAKAYGAILKIGMTFTSKRTEAVFLDDESPYLGLLRHYFIPLGRFALTWHPVKRNPLGRISICVRMKE